MKYKKSGELKIDEKNDNYYVLDLQSQRIVVLNKTAAFILECCNGLNSFEDIERKTLRNFNLPMSTDIKEDIISILSVLPQNPRKFKHYLR